MRVQLTYFKDSGKYYSEGEYKTEKESLHEIWAEAEEMFNQGRRPGLGKGHDGFHVLINVAGHKHEHPRLMLNAA
jgi:hypothetical protein